MHNNLVVKSSAMQNIPKFSTYRDIYQYTYVIKEYQKQHGIDKRNYTEKEITTIFLDCLDHPYFNVIVSNINTQLRNLSVITQE